MGRSALRKCYQERPLLVLAQDPPTGSDFRPGLLKSIRQDFKGLTKEKGNRKIQSGKIPEQNFHSTQEEFHRRKAYSRPFSSKYLHQTPLLQDANFKRGKTDITQGLLDNFTRPKGRLLACSSMPREESLLRIPVEETKLAVQGDAFRTEYSPTHIHQTYSTCGKGDDKSRDLVPPLLGRPSHHCPDKGRMFVKDTKGTGNTFIARMDIKREKISSNASSKVRLARSIIRPGRPLSRDPRGDNGFLSHTLKEGNLSSSYLSKGNNATPRSGKLDKSPRPCYQTDPSKNPKNHQVPQRSGIRYTNHIESRISNKFMQMVKGHTISSETRFTSSRYNHPDGCLPGRMGLSNKQQLLLRKVRRNNVILYKRIRNTDNLVLSVNDRRQRSSHSDSVGQHISYSSNKEELPSGLPSVSNRGAHLEEGSSLQMDNHDISHQGLLQCSSRPTFQTDRTSVGMVTSPKRLQKDTQTEPSSSSGSVRDQTQQSTTNLCFSVPGRKRSSDRCSVYSMGQVETPVHLSPNKLNFEGFSEDDRDLGRKYNSNYARLTQQTVVHVLDSQEDSFIYDGSHSTAESSGQNSIPFSDYKTSRVETIKESFRRKFPKCDAIDLMLEDLSENTLRDYEHKWKSFLKYLEEENIPQEEVIVDYVLNFLKKLFIKYNLKPGTILKYKTALTNPLMAKFKINIKIPEATILMNAMKKARPDKPSKEPHWNLNKVLKYIDEELPDSPSIEYLLRKTAFLLLLATGMRVSELHACLRTKDCCVFTEDNFLKIGHHHLFLAKNEKPDKRWSLRVVKPLYLQDGSISKLCPVSSLRTYLNRTSDFKKGRIFRSTGRISKELTKNQLSTEICKLIVRADPGTKAKVHDIRSYASSCALASTMITPTELAQSIGWSSPATFYRFYRTAIEPLSREVSLPGPDPRIRRL